VTISNAEDRKMQNNIEMISFVKHQMDDIVEKRANIDGKELCITEEFRCESPPFKFTYPARNIFEGQPGRTKGVGDGYWLFMRPMNLGNHTITTFGSCMSGKIQIGATIKLIVEGDDSYVALQQQRYSK
jgi:hypothetical protein